MNKQGFTLIEILIALTVFAILSTITTSALYFVFSSREKLNAQADKLSQLQMALILIERDIEQFENRPIHIDQQYKPSIIGKRTYLEFTRSGLFNPLTTSKQSSLQRVALFYQNNQLIRRTWPRLDTLGSRPFTEQVLLDGVEAFHFGYLDKNSTVLNEWQSDALSDKNQVVIPKAIQVNLNLSDWGNMTLLLIIPEGNYRVNDQT